MLIPETHLGLVVGRGRLDDDGRLGRLGADLHLGNEGLAGESGGGESSHFVGERWRFGWLGARMVDCDTHRDRKLFPLRITIFFRRIDQSSSEELEKCL